MFGLANLSEIETITDLTSATEGWMQSIAQSLFGIGPVLQTFRHSYELSDYAPWYCFVTPSGARLALGIGRMVQTSPCCGVFFDLAARQTQLKKLVATDLLSPLSKLRLVECLNSIEGMTFSVGYLPGRSSELAFGVHEQTFNSFGRPHGQVRLNLGTTEVSLAALIDIAQCELLIKERKGGIELTRLSLNSRGISVIGGLASDFSFRGGLIMEVDKIEQLTETADAAQVYVTVELGQFQIDIEKLLRLRPGMRIELDLPKEFISDLVVAGVSWAKARTSFHDGKLELFIEALAGASI